MDGCNATGRIGATSGDGRAGRRWGLDRILPLTPFALAALVAWGCAGQAAAADFVRSQSTQAPGNETAATQAASSVDALGFDLLAKTPAGNAVISPASVALALAMARAGAAGDTAAQMDTVMHGLWASGGGSGIASFDRALNGLSSTFTAANGDKQTIEVDVANASFAQRNLAFAQAYLDSLATSFDAGQRLVDFASDPGAARAAINKWVDDQTKGRIPALLDSLDPATRLVLVNAIYMKAAWRDPFQVAATADATFNRADGTTVSVPTMNQLLEGANYASETGWQAIELPYGNGSLVMDVVVPDNLATFAAKLDANQWHDVLAGMHGSTVQLALPRFSTESKLQLANALSALGMPLAFDPEKADFAGMTAQEKLYIAAVVHQANISVDEKGTEASAATAVVMAGSAMPAEPIKLTVDRPFLFAVRDSTSGAVVFLGRIVDPSAK